MTKIYVLVDPTTGQVRYIGKTEGTVTARLRGHLEKSRNPKNKWHVATWIRSITAKGMLPVIETIREVETVYGNETEIFCIAEYYRMGCDLTNGTVGGDGGATGPRENLHTVEAMRKRKGNTNSGSAWRGKKQPPEVISARMAGYTPEKRREAHRKAQETRQRRKAVASAFGVDLYSRPAHNHGAPVPAETKEKLRQSALTQWSNYTEEQRATYAEQARTNLEEFRGRIAAGEIDHPCKGKDPWNKGLDQGPDVGIKSWKTKRANGFVSQKDMLIQISVGCGHSVAKVSRALKGQGHKVKVEIVQEIWAWYEKNKDDFPNLTVIFP